MNSMTADEFHRLRVEYGSQASMALALGVSQSMISIYECGYRPIPDHVVTLIRHTIELGRVAAKITGKSIYDFRVTAGITQKQLSKVMMVSPVTISNWESGGEEIKLSPRQAKRFLELDPATTDFSDEELRYQYGVELADQDWALDIVGNRYTIEHVPERAQAVGRVVFPEFSSDAEFLAGTIFRVSRNGALAYNQKQVICVPTWPTIPQWRYSRPVITLGVLSGAPSSKANGSQKFRQRFEDEVFAVKLRRRDAELKLKAENVLIGRNDPRGDEFCKWLIANKLDQNSAAIALGVSPDYIHHWITGRLPPPYNLMAQCRAAIEPKEPEQPYSGLDLNDVPPEGKA